jgi:hypothetical protein
MKLDPTKREVHDERAQELEPLECQPVESNKDDAARRILNEIGEEKTPDGAPYSFSSVRAALVGVES